MKKNKKDNDLFGRHSAIRFSRLGLLQLYGVNKNEENKKSTRTCKTVCTALGERENDLSSSYRTFRLTS